MHEREQGEQIDLGQKVLNAVERITDANDEVLALVERLRVEGEMGSERHAQRVISHYSTRSAVVGGVTALPGMLPGLGTALMLTAGPLADMVMLLKYETELCLALTAVHGYDIHDPAERQLAFLLAALKTAEIHPDRSVLCDGLEVTGSSIYRYAPRRVGKLLVTSVAALAAVAMSRGLLRAIPLIGVAVGASMNKVLTARAGRQAHEELRLRRRLSGVPA